MDQLIKDKSVGSKGINQQALHIETPIHDRWAKRSEVLIMEVNDTLSEILNVQGALLWDWRSQLVDELAKPLLEKDAIEELREAEAEGDQHDAYSRTLEAQARAEVMLSAYASVLADRRELLVGQRSALATHDYKPLKKRRKNKAQKDDGDANHDNIIANMELDARPEDEVFAASLRVQREAVFHKYREEDVKDGRPLRKLFNELGTIAGM
jgi:E3 ubiquitin-protein ligase SHPRH